MGTRDPSPVRDEDDSHKLTKKEVSYGPGKEESHCGNCEHFEPGENPFGDATCEIVNGPVRWHRWCERWVPDEDVS